MSHDLNRRRFIAWFSTAGMATLLAPEVLAQGEGAITLAAIQKAESIAGVSFTVDERELLAEGVRDHLSNYEALRELPIGNAVQPAIRFSPLLPGRTVPQEADEPIRATPVHLPAVPTKSDDLAFLPLTHLASLIRERMISSYDLTRFYLGRLHRFNEQLQCVITFTDELALNQARQADREIMAGDYRGPLHGIPYGIKDLFTVPGFPTTWGAVPYRNQVLEEASTVYQRLTEAGAVCIAKTSVGALAWGDVWFGGTTKNPWNLEQGSSGSSAGSAAGTAAGLFGFAIGTETLGSIISPSHRCGATGLRPTFGRVSRNGCMALSWTMDKVGPICRSVEDTALVLDAIRGADGMDSCAVDAPFNWDAPAGTAGIRVGYDTEAFTADSPDKKFQDSALRALRSGGIVPMPVKLPDFPGGDLVFVLEAEAAAAFDELTRSDEDATMVRQVAQAWPNVFRTARLIPAVEYIQAQRARTLLMEQFERVFDKVDVYIHPTYGGRTLLATNLTGHPSVVVPNGFREDGTPTSITFTGNLYGEAKLLAVAKAYQDATGHHRRRPSLS